MKPAPPVTRTLTKGSSPRAAPRQLPEAVQCARGRLGFLEGEGAGQPFDLPQDFPDGEFAQGIARSRKALAAGRLYQAQQLPLPAQGEGEHLVADALAQFEQPAHVPSTQHALIIPVVHPLDDPQTYERLDPQRMTDLVVRFPDMGEEAWQTAMRLRLPPSGEYSAILVLGMGGSGVGGDLLAALLRPVLPVPVIVVKDHGVPAFVGPQTLVFACSYSGNTEETISAYTAAKQAGAPAIVITSGGVLQGLATAHGDPFVLVPPGMPPRAALPYLFLPMVSVLRRLTHMGELSGDWAEARRVLRAMAADLGPQSPSERNPAKQLAERLRGHMPAVYASTSDLAAVAYRWKTQFSENGKVLALWQTFPELNHNETVGWEDEATAARLAVVLLVEPDEEAEVRRRVAATRDVAFGAAASVTEVTARGVARLARLLSLVLFGDFTSVYLALLRGVDPTPVWPIDEIKRRLSQRA